MLPLPGWPPGRERCGNVAMATRTGSTRSQKSKHYYYCLLSILFVLIVVVTISCCYYCSYHYYILLVHIMTVIIVDNLLSYKKIVDNAYPLPHT